MRKRREEEHVDSEKWAVPYADLLTLLLAFFVVMYSLSQINTSKYRVLAESLNQAFNGTGKVIQPVSPAAPARKVPLPNKARAVNATPIALIRVPVPPQRMPLPGHEGAAAKPSQGHDAHAAAGKAKDAAEGKAKGAAEGKAKGAAEGKATADLKTMSDEIGKALQPWVASHQVVIRQTKLWLEIEIRTDILFPSGVAQLSDPAGKVLDGVAQVVGHFPNPIRIEGYTDNRPIDTFKFPSNWELSAARAGSVARLFSAQGVDPRRIGIFGWGQYHPVASNATPAGRNRNRRIVIVVLANHGPAQRYGDDANDDPMVASTPLPGKAAANAAAQAKPVSASPASGSPDSAVQVVSPQVAAPTVPGSIPHKPW